MKTLLVSDVHEKLDRLWNVISEERLDRVDRIVFVGDYFDTFKRPDVERLRQLCRFLLVHVAAGGISMSPERRFVPATWLLGNHDLHYFYPHRGLRCTGWNETSQQIILEMLPVEIIRKFKLVTTVGPYLVSHAGFNEFTISMAGQTAQDYLCKELSHGRIHWAFGEQGPFMIRWHQLRHMEDTPQIVGHTWQQEPDAKGPAIGPQTWNIDTGLRHALIVDDETGVVEIEEVPV